MKRKLHALSILIFFGSGAFAQNMLGISSSNYAGTHGVIANPSYAADTRHGFYFNLFSGNGFVTNSYYVWDGPMSPFQFFESGEKFEESYLLANNLDKPSMVHSGVDLRGPSILLKLSPKSGISLQTRVRGLIQGNNLSPNFIELLKSGIDLEDNIDEQFRDNTFSVNGNIVSEVGLTYARTVLENKHHYLKAGITVKRLIGSFSAHLVSDRMDYTIRRNATSLEYAIEIEQMNLKYGYNTDEFNDADFEELLNPFKSNARGNGWGFDIGLTYEKRSKINKYRYTMDGVESLDNRKNKYDYRIGFSLLDVGGVRYKGSGARSYDIGVSDKIITEEDLDAADGEIIAFINDALDISPTSGKNELKSGLPTAVRMDIDYKLATRLYANLSVYQNLRGEEASGMRQNSLVALSPRFESKWFEFALPVSLMNNYKSLALGASIKLANVFVGSDNLNSIIGIGKAHGADLYVGMSIPIYKGRKRDRDRDGVSNRKDDCKNKAGVWAFKGCPDTDGDGVEDKIDQCIDVAGLVEFQGCPDTDGDGVRDSEDECPQLAGPAILKGCPDTDGDNIPDHLDACPDNAGLEQYNGCPDTDGDGLIDSEDKCPEIAGTEAFDGCPDTDGDGVPDNLDECPTVAGLTRYNGCPDTDGDGIIDSNDKCPEDVGPASNEGCPLIEETVAVDVKLTEEEAQIVQDAYDNLEFTSGKAVIAASSRASLTSLADVLKGKPSLMLQVSGHTDSIGKIESNLKLSRDRANAVKDFLVKAGVLPSQIITEGFGASQPIATNETEEGRKLNRRVEMKVI